MADESYGFTAARARLEEIVAQVRKKDTSLEKSLDLLEEGVRLANICTEQIDHADWVADAASEESGQVEATAEARESGQGEVVTTEVAETVAVVEDVVVIGETGEVVAELVEVTEYETAGEDAAAGHVPADEADASDAAQPTDRPADDDARD